jgi:DNA-binding beta-propeller fold protein YncE
VIASTDGSTVWVAARGSNALLGFSTEKLQSDPGHALVATVPVGEEPVGLALFDQDRRIIVADSNRSSVEGASADIAVVDTQAAIARRPALLGTIPTGLFPREIAVNGNTALVTNYNSEQVEVVNLADLP